MCRFPAALQTSITGDSTRCDVNVCVCPCVLITTRSNWSFILKCVTPQLFPVSQKLISLFGDFFCFLFRLKIFWKALFVLRIIKPLKICWMIINTSTSFICLTLKIKRVFRPILRIYFMFSSSCIIIFISYQLLEFIKLHFRQIKSCSWSI